MKGQEINAHFGELKMGKMMRKPVMIDGIKFNMFVMKDPNYAMKLMSTYGCLNVKRGQKKNVRDHEGGIKKLNMPKRLQIILIIIV